MQFLANQSGRTFSDAVVIEGDQGRWIFVAGKLGVQGERRIDLDFEAEVRACFAAVEATLATCGAQMRDVARIDVFITDLLLYPTFSRVRGDVFPANPPTSTAVQVAGLLNGARIEVTATAFSSVRAQLER